MDLREIVRRAARFSSLRTLLILGLGVVAATCFVEVADEVLEGEAESVDREISHWVRQLDSAAVVRAMLVVTQLGSVWFLGAVVALVSAWALARRRRTLAGLYGATVLANGVIIVLLKLLFQRPRPDLVGDITTPDTFSFPSGHAMGAIVVLGMSAFVVRRITGARRGALYGAVAFVVFLGGLSRVYLGVHWTTDVLAGYAAGAILLAAAGLASARIDRDTLG